MPAPSGERISTLNQGITPLRGVPTKAAARVTRTVSERCVRGCVGNRVTYSLLFFIHSDLDSCMWGATVHLAVRSFSSPRKLHILSWARVWTLLLQRWAADLFDFRSLFVLGTCIALLLVPKSVSRIIIAIIGVISSSGIGENSHEAS